MTNFVFIIMTKNVNMKSNGLHITLQKARKGLGLSMQEVSRRTGIAQALISKFENNYRLPTDEQLKAFSQLYQLSYEELRKQKKAEKIVYMLLEDEDALSILHVAESRMEYLKSSPKAVEYPISEEVAKQLNHIDSLKRQWRKNQPLKGIQLDKMREYFAINYTHESNRIEGNTLTLQETQLVVNEGLTIGGKSMKEHLEAINHAEAVNFLYDLVTYKEAFDQRTLLDLHSLILKSIDKENAGRYRMVPVRISGSTHIPPQPYMLGKLMEEYFEWYGEQKDKLHPVILSAEMHERLVSIHPFIDGNGRTARLVMNLILLQHGYPIAILKGNIDARMEYYKALESCQANNEPEHFYRLVANAVERSIEEHLALAGR